MAARASLAAVALVVLAWLAVMERDARLQASGFSAATQPRVAERFARADADLRGARLLNPDTTPDLARALLRQAAGRPAEARALLDDLLRREPDNLAAWRLLRSVAADGDPAAARRALAAERRLDPVNARRPR